MSASEKRRKAPSSSEEGVGGGGPMRELMLQRASQMRRNMPEPERRLWMERRNSRLCGNKFRRQAVMGSRIVDFFCPTKGIVVEIDGDTHDSERDAIRDKRLADYTGFQILRFTNDDIMRNMDGVLTALKIALEQRADRWLNRREHHPPTPSSEEEGE